MELWNGVLGASLFPNSIWEQVKTSTHHSHYSAYPSCKLIPICQIKSSLLQLKKGVDYCHLVSITSPVKGSILISTPFPASKFAYETLHRGKTPGIIGRRSSSLINKLAVSESYLDKNSLPPLSCATCNAFILFTGPICKYKSAFSRQKSKKV